MKYQGTMTYIVLKKIINVFLTRNKDDKDDND